MCCRTNIIVLIRVSVVLPFHKCLRLLRLRLYTVSTPHVNNDAAIVAHISYISLLRCNYYHEYLACDEEDLWTIHITWDWELLSGERLVILLKIAHLQPNGTWETNPVPKYESSCFRKKNRSLGNWSLSVESFFFSSRYQASVSKLIIKLVTWLRW